MIEFLNSNKDAFASIQAIATTIAILVGGFWSYRLFVKKRLKHAKATISHCSSTLICNDEQIILRNLIVLKNIGETKIKITKGFSRVQIIIPYEDYAINNEMHDVILNRMESSTEIGWPLAEEISFNDLDIEIEPNEEEEIACDHILQSGIEKVTFYTYIKNKNKRRLIPFLSPHEIGWSHSSIHKINNERK